MKYRYFFLTAIAMSMLSSLIGCTSKHRAKEPAERDLVSLESIKCRDSIFDRNNSKIVVTSNVTYPAFFENEKETAALKDLFSKSILNQPCNDSISIDKAIDNFSKGIIDSYKTPVDESHEQNFDDGENKHVMEYEIANYIKPIFDGFGIICFQKTSEIKKDGKQTMETNYYYSFNLNSMTRVDISDIFNVEYFEQVNAMLKEQLLKQEKVSSPTQLIDLGYFNIDNLAVNNNFYLTNDSIVFNYEPYEIACLAIGEVSIKLNYFDLQQFFKPDFSELLRIQ